MEKRFSLNKVQRQSSDRQFEAQAAERNSYREAYEKFFRMNKVTGRDMLRDQADRINTLVDESVERSGGTYQAAADRVAESQEFEVIDPNPREVIVRRIDTSGRVSESSQQFLAPAAERAQDRIEFAEFLRSIDPNAEKSIERGDLGPASEIIGEIADAAPDYGTRHMYHMGLINMIADKIDTMVKAGDIETLQHLILVNELRFVPAASLESMPPEVFASPDVREQALQKIEGMSGTENFAARLKGMGA